MANKTPEEDHPRSPSPFHLNLVTVLLLNALRSWGQWKISKKDGKFDNLILELDDGSTTLIQMIYAENKNITKELLLSHNSEAADFSLPKYFFLCEEIKVNDIIICTNTDLDLNGLENMLNLLSVGPKNMLYYKGGSFIQFNENILPELKASAELYCNKHLKSIEKSAVTDEHMRIFLKKLHIFENYPRGSNIYKVIEHLITRLNASKLYRQTCYSEIYRKVWEWFQHSQNNLSGVDARAMFSEIRSDQYCKSLNNYHVSFKYNEFNFTDSKRLFHVMAEDGYFMQMLKIHYTLQGDQNKKLFVNPEEDIDVQKHIIEAFEMPDYVYLIMTCSNTMNEAVKIEVSGKIRKILTNFWHKKVILVASGKSRLVQQIGLIDISQFDGSVIFQDLSLDSQQKLLKRKIVDYQDFAVSIKELLGPQPIEDSIKFSNSEMEKIITMKKIKVGMRLLDLDDNVARYYIPRSFERNVHKTKKISVFAEQSIFDVDEKVVLIEGRAGMGKSTTLTKLAMIIKAQRPNLWVIKINVNDYIMGLTNNRRKLSVTEMLDSQKATIFHSTDDFEKFVFSLKERVVLMLDGTEEIGVDYIDMIPDLIANCQQAPNFTKIFVTTTPHLSRQLEANLNVDSFKMQPFSEQNQINFLTQYWTHNLHNETITYQYANTLVNTIFSRVQLNSHRESDVTLTPLQVMMFAEIYQQNITRKEATDGMEYTNNLHGNEAEPKYDLTKLYTLFIEKKRDQAVTDLFEESREYLHNLALELILGKKKSYLFPNYHKGSKDADNVENYVLGTGIVQKLDDRFQFAHRTLAEYFVADSIITRLQGQHQNVKLQKFVINTILSNSAFSSIRAFMDGFLQNNSSFPVKVFTSYANTLTKRNLGYWLEIEGFATLSQIILKSIHSKTYAWNTKLSRSKKQDKINIAGKKVLKLGADKSIHSKTYAWNTKLSRSKKEDKINIAGKKVLKLGADSRITDNTNETASHLAEKGELDTINLIPECSRKKDQLEIIKNVTAGKDSKLDSVTCFKETGTYTNIRDDSGRTSLHLAVIFQQLNTVKSLVNSGVDLNVTDKEGRTALHLASQNGALDIVKFLMTLDIQANVRDNNGRTSLHLAAEEGELEVIEYLVKTDIDINTKDYGGRTPLHLAVEYDKLDTIKCLITHKADVNAKDDEGYTPLHLAVISDEFDTVKLLVESGANFKTCDNEGRTAVHLAIESDQLVIAKFLEEREVDLKVTEIHTTKKIQTEVVTSTESTVNFKEEVANFTALHSADLQKLLESEVDLNTRDNEGRTILHAAASQGLLDVVKLLIDHQVDVNLRDDDGNTALHLADDGNHLDIVKYLVEHGSNINITDGDNNTVLHCAAEIDRLNSVKYFVEEAEANVNIKGNGGRTPLHLAVRWANSDIVKYLLNQDGINLNTTDNRGRTPLHFAAARHSLEIVKLLVQHKADVNVKDKDGSTAIHLAARAKNVFSVEYLVENGAGINITDGDRRTVLHLVAEGGEADVVKFLVDRGADITIRDMDDCTALDLAETKGHMDVVEYLNTKLQQK